MSDEPVTMDGTCMEPVIDYVILPTQGVIRLTILGYLKLTQAVFEKAKRQNNADCTVSLSVTLPYRSDKQGEVPLEG